MNLNRAMRRLLHKPKPHKTNWECPKCGKTYPLIWAQSKAEPYYFCKDSCNDFFDDDGNNVTAKIYPTGKPWGDK